MFQIAFRPSYMNWAYVFEWHKILREGRKSVRDDERCVRSKEVRTPGLIGQMKNFIDKDRRVSMETISAPFDVSVGTVHTIIREQLKMRKICAKFIPRVLREVLKERRFHDSGEMIELTIQIPQLLMLWWPAMKTGSTAMTQRPKDRVCSGSMLAHLDLRRPDRENLPTIFLMIPFFDSTGMIWMHWIPTGQTVNKEYYVEVLKEFRKWFRRRRPALFKSGQLHFQLDNAPVHNSILVTDYLTKMGIKTVPQPLYSTDLVLCDFGYSLSSRKNLEAAVIRQLRIWKRLRRRSLTCPHKRTSMAPSRRCCNVITCALQPEEITSKGTRVLCVYYA